MANAGRVELDLVAVGKDQVSAMLRQVDQQLRKTAGEMSKTGMAVGGLGEHLDAIKAKAAGVNKVRETFENLRGNAMFVLGGVGALAGAFIALTEAVSSNARALREWEEASKAIFEATAKPPKLLEEIAEFLGEKVSTPATKMLDQIREGVGKLEVQIEQAKAGAAALQAEYDKVLSGGIKAGEMDEELARKRNGALAALAVLEGDREQLLREQEKVQIRITKELETQGRLARTVVSDIGRMLTALVGAAADTALGGGGGGSLASQLFKGKTGTGLGKPKVASGRGGAPSTSDVDAEFRAMIGLQKKLAGDATDAVFGVSSGGGNIASGGTSGDATVGLARMATDAEKLAAALQQVADATGLVAQAMPEMGSALAEVQAITAQVVEGKMSLNNALAAGATAIAANAAKAIGGVRAEAAVRAAYEVGMGFATIGNPFVSAGHFTAAALLGAVAAGAGGGGGGSRAGGSSRGESRGGGSNGPSTVVYNFSTLVTDRQQVVSAVRQSQRSTRGTGLDTRAGV